MGADSVHPAMRCGTLFTQEQFHDTPDQTPLHGAFEIAALKRQIDGLHRIERGKAAMQRDHLACSPPYRPPRGAKVLRVGRCQDAASTKFLRHIDIFVAIYR